MDALVRRDAESFSRPGVPGTHREFDRPGSTVWRLRQRTAARGTASRRTSRLCRYMVEEAHEAAAEAPARR